MPFDRPALVAAARRSIRKGSKSFATASRLFDRVTRERVWLLYAWCRACDDIIDDQDHGHSAGSAQPLDPAVRLETVRTLTELALAGQTTGSPAFDALGQLSREVPITHAMVDDVLTGFALDMADWRPRTEADLLRYCFHVAGAVGVLMAVVMGVPAEGNSPETADTLDRACDLGLAFQLANIVRDIGEDGAIGRCYLPTDWLAEARIPPGQLTQPRYAHALLPLIGRACDLAMAYEDSARIGARRLTWRQRWAVLSAANIYGAIGREVRRKGPRAWDERIHIAKHRKLGLVAHALIESQCTTDDADHRAAPLRITRRDLTTTRVN